MNENPAVSTCFQEKQFHSYIEMSHLTSHTLNINHGPESSVASLLFDADKSSWIEPVSKVKKTNLCIKKGAERKESVQDAVIPTASLQRNHTPADIQPSEALSMESSLIGCALKHTLEDSKAAALVRPDGLFTDAGAETKPCKSAMIPFHLYKVEKGRDLSKQPRKSQTPAFDWSVQPPRGRRALAPSLNPPVLYNDQNLLMLVVPCFLFLSQGFLLSSPSSSLSVVPFLLYEAFRLSVFHTYSAKYWPTKFWWLMMNE